jgi:HAMP domain-containing protein
LANKAGLILNFRKRAEDMPAIPFTTLRAKIALFIIVLLLVTAGIFSFFTVQTMNSRITDEVTKRAEALCKSTAALAPYSMLAGDVLGMDNIVAKVKGANPDVDYVAVADDKMQTVAHTRVEERGRNDPVPEELISESSDGTIIIGRIHIRPFLEIMTPIVYKNIQMGSVIIGINNSMLHAARTETRKRIFKGFVIVILLGAGCIVILSSVVARPIKELSLGVEELKAGRRTKLRIYSHDELGKLTASFNQMTEKITRQQDRLSAYAAELEEAYVSTVKGFRAIDAQDPTHSATPPGWRVLAKIGRPSGSPEGWRTSKSPACSMMWASSGRRTPCCTDGPLDAMEHHEVPTTATWRGHPGRAPSLQKYIPRFGTTTNGTTERAIPTGCAARTSRCTPPLSALPMLSTP